MERSHDPLDVHLPASMTSFLEGKAVWYAGDWTGPRILQPEKRLSGDSTSSRTHDIVAMSPEGVKVIMVDFNSLQNILRNGSSLYRRYHLSLSQQHSCKIPSTIVASTASTFKNAVRNLNVVELLESNTGLRKLTAIQKRHLECLVEGPEVYTPGQRLWRTGSVVEKAFIVVAGTVSFVPKRRHAGSAGQNLKVQNHRVKQTQETNSTTSAENIGEAMRNDAVKAVRELQATLPMDMDDNESEGAGRTRRHGGSLSNSFADNPDYQRLRKGLEKWAERQEQGADIQRRRGSSCSDHSPDVSLHDLCNASEVPDEGKIETRRESSGVSESNTPLAPADDSQRQLSKNRFANKVLGRLYNRRAFATGLVFSRGHFLGDIEKMVEGLLSSSNSYTENDETYRYSDTLEQFGFGKDGDSMSLDAMTIQEMEMGHNTPAHSSTLAAGKDGCVVLILPKASLIPFLDAHPGLLLSLMGTQVLV